jgi:MinD-like ATPase involved in chromosome partitioning or flagellar assembly
LIQKFIWRKTNLFEEDEMSKVYAITSGKGGVGKTTIAANLGVSLGRRRKKTIVVDADLAMV